MGVYRGGFFDWANRRLWVLAQPPQSLSPVPVGQLVEGTLRTTQSRIRRGGWAILSAALADEHHLHIGERFTLPAPHPIMLRVAALATNLGWPPGAIVMNSNDYATAWQSTQPSAYEIQTRAGVPLDLVAKLVQRTIGLGTGLRVETVEQRTARHYALAAQGLSRLSQIRSLVLIASILAVIAAMGAMLWHRRGEVARLKGLGYKDRVLRHWLAVECGMMLGIGCLAGMLAGIYGEVLNSHALAIVTGFPVFFHPATLEAITSLGLFAARSGNRLGSRISRGSCASPNHQPSLLTNRSRTLTPLRYPHGSYVPYSELLGAICSGGFPTAQASYRDGVAVQRQLPIQGYENKRLQHWTTSGHNLRALPCSPYCQSSAASRCWPLRSPTRWSGTISIAFTSSDQNWITASNCIGR